MPWSTTTSSTSSRLKVPRFSLTSIWSSDSRDSRSSGSSADLPEPTTPTTPGRDNAIDTTPRPPTADSAIPWTGDKDARQSYRSVDYAISDTPYAVTEESFNSPETMDTVESWNVETPRGDRNSKGLDASHKVTPSGLFQPGEAFARRMGPHSDSFDEEISHIPESDLQVVLDDSPTVPATRPFAPTHHASSSTDWQTAQKASALLHSVILNDPPLSEKQRGKLPVPTCDESEENHTNEALDAELVEGITMANAEASRSSSHRTSSLLTSSSSSSSERHPLVRPSIPTRKSSRLTARIPPRSSSPAEPLDPARPAFPSRGSSLTVHRVDSPQLSRISSRTSVATASSFATVQIATSAEPFDSQKPLLSQNHRNPPPKAPPRGLFPPLPGLDLSLPSQPDSGDSVHSVLSLLDTLQAQAARPKPTRAATALSPLPRLALRRVHSQPKLVRHYDPDDSMQLPFKFRMKRSGSTRLTAEPTKSIHPMADMPTSQTRRLDKTPHSQSLSFSQKLSARWSGSLRGKSGRAKPNVRPGLSALPETWLNQPEQHAPGGFYVDQLESPEPHQTTFTRITVRDTFAPAMPDSPTLLGHSQHRDSITGQRPLRESLSGLPHRELISTSREDRSSHPLPSVPSPNRPRSIMSDISLEAHAAEWATDVLTNLEEARAALREAESWFWPSPPPRTPAVPSLDGEMSTSVSASTLGVPITPPVSQAQSLDPALGQGSALRPGSGIGSGSGGPRPDVDTWSRTRAKTSKIIFDALEPSALRREQGFGMVEKYHYVQNNMDGTPGVVVEGTRRVTGRRGLNRR